MSIFRRRRRGPRRPWRLRCFAVIAALLLALAALDTQLRPILFINACNRAKNTAVVAVNEAMAQTLDGLQSDYDDIITVDYADDGSIRALRANAAAVNRIKTAANLGVSEYLAALTLPALQIPLGTLTGVSFFSGKGPLISCRMLVGHTPLVSLDSELTAAGINQTRHQITLRVTVPLTVMLPLQSDTISVETAFLLAETVLIGEVPDAYTDVISDPQLVGDIFDYADLE